MTYKDLLLLLSTFDKQQLSACVQLNLALPGIVGYVYPRPTDFVYPVPSRERWGD